MLRTRKENEAALKWLVNRLNRKYKIPKKTAMEVIGAIADLEWDWRNSKFDLSGLMIEEILERLGNSRRPKGYKEFGDWP